MIPILGSMLSPPVEGPTLPPHGRTRGSVSRLAAPGRSEDGTA